MENNYYSKVVELSDEDQIKLYMKLKKKELATMLLNANKHIKQGVKLNYEPRNEVC